MKLFSSYLKEMKIAFRGFYFYIEILVAVLLLLVIIFTINPDPDGKAVEYLYYDMPEEVFDYLVDKDITEGKARWVEDTELELKPIAFDLENNETGEVVSYGFKDTKTVTARTFVGLRENTGKIAKTAHILDSEEDALRLSFQNGNIAATTTMNEEGEFSYRYFLQGYETDRHLNMLYVLSSFFDTISKAFGILYMILIAMMLPAFSYYISSFDPVWLRFFPTYPALQVMKDILMGQEDVFNVMMYSSVFLVSGIVLLAMANYRFKKTLTV